MSVIESHVESVALRPVTGNSLSEVKALGQVFKASGYFKDIRDEAQAVTKILYGRELGFTPIVSIMGIYIIDGKPSLSSNLLATMIKRSGKYDYRVKENSATRCELEFRVRNDAGQWEPLGVTEFTMEEAKAAGVAGKDNWRKYPKAMLFARALSAGARAHCPDVSVCPIYVPEELGASVTEEGDVTELPKAARNVEVTQEEIPLSSHAEPRPTNTIPQTDADGTGEMEPPPKVEYCSQGQAINFHKTFKEACAEGVDADTYAHDYLAKGNYFDPEKPGQNVPSAKGIPKANFEQVKAAAKTYARSLKLS